MTWKLETLFDVCGKVAVVTGGGGTLCGTLAEALGDLGVRVAILDLKPEGAERRAEAIRSRGGEALVHVCSVLDRESLEGVRAAVVARWGAPDFLINGAGGNDPRASTEREFQERGDLEREGIFGFFDIGLAAFNDVFSVNFQGTFLPTQVFARDMVKEGRGSIVNISSLNAFTPLTKIPAYSSAKAAVANFTRWLAVHFARTGVRVNALAPGFFMTEQLRFLHVDQQTGEYTPRAKKVIAQTPMGRYGNPEELVGVVVWLLSGAASFVTGSLLSIDGGFSSYSL